MGEKMLTSQHGRCRFGILSGLLLSLTIFGATVAGVTGANKYALADEQAELAMRPPEYRTGSGDRLRITVFGHDDLSGEFQVDGSGNISLPLIGNVAVGDRSMDDIENAIVKKLKPDYLKNPRVNVEVVNYRPFYILGEVNNPGSYPYVNGMTVVNAIALSGGYTYRAREDKVLITRSDDPERTKKPATLETVVMPGDIIEVPERFF
jgi:polysaccharide export outer membrane protein